MSAVPSQEISRPAFPALVVQEAAGPRGDDRAAFFAVGETLVVVVADGAGGAMGGARAAETVLRMVRDEVGPAFPFADLGAWCGLFVRLDEAIESDPEAGECTAVVAAVTRDRIVGASVGDSQAWHLTRAGTVDLTARQRRRPLLGSGGAVPVPFRERSRVGLVLVATDGLFKYAKGKAIRETLREDDLAGSAGRLVELVRLPSGTLCDDVSVVLIDTR